MRLYLGGGGSPQDEAALWQEWVRPGLHCVYWPFALEPSAYGEGARWLRAALGPDVALETWDDLAQRGPSDLDGVDVLMVGGGNTYALLDHIQRTSWGAHVRRWVQDGGEYFGDSAGAVIAGEDIDVARFADPNDVGISDTAGLGLLPGALLRPHLEPGDVPELRGWAQRSGLTVVGLPERGGAVVVDGRISNPGPDDVVIVTPSREWVLLAGEAADL